MRRKTPQVTIVWSPEHDIKVKDERLPLAVQVEKSLGLRVAWVNPLLALQPD